MGVPERSVRRRIAASRCRAFAGEAPNGDNGALARCFATSQSRMSAWQMVTPGACPRRRHRVSPPAAETESC